MSLQPPAQTDVCAPRALTKEHMQARKSTMYTGTAAARHTPVESRPLPRPGCIRSCPSYPCLPAAQVTHHACAQVPPQSLPTRSASIPYTSRPTSEPCVPAALHPAPFVCLCPHCPCHKLEATERLSRLIPWPPPSSILTASMHRHHPSAEPSSMAHLRLDDIGPEDHGPDDYGPGDFGTSPRQRTRP